MEKQRREALEAEIEGSRMSMADSSLVAHELRALLADSAAKERVEMLPESWQTSADHMARNQWPEHPARCYQLRECADELDKALGREDG